MSVGVGLFGPDFRLDHDELAAAFSERTKALVINTPHNLTGVVLDRPTWPRSPGWPSPTTCW